MTLCWITDTSFFDTWVSKPACIPCVRALSSTCNGFLGLTSSSTPADPMTASMASKPFLIHVLVHVYVGIGGTRYVG